MTQRGRFLPDCLLLAGLVWLQLSGAVQAAEVSDAVEVFFDETDYAFSAEEKQQITDLARRTEQEVRTLLPELPSGIQVQVSALDRDLSVVGGVTGRADSPTRVVVYISTVFDNGVTAAVNTGLAPVLYHEFHHLVRGWTIAGNRYGPGITIAAINEGLANVFSETYTRTAFPGNAYPANVSAWWQEITALPVTANYSHWMVEHPDGREAIAYKAGSFIVRQALARSSYSIVELTDLSVEEILSLVAENP